MNSQDKWGYTPLHGASGPQTPLLRASENGHVEVITALLAAGADKTIEDEDGNTPHDVAWNQDCRNALE